MKPNIKKLQIAGFIFTGIVGVILHFLFNWTDESIIVAPFSAVNESIFEHMKLLFVPMFVFAIYEQKYVKYDYSNFWCIKLRGILLGIVLIPVLYYTISGALGFIPDWVNIAIFFITAAISYYYETLWFNSDSKKDENCRASLIILIIIAVIFVILTFVPPHIPLFEDPLSSTYGFFKSI